MNVLRKASCLISAVAFLFCGTGVQAKSTKNVAPSDMAGEQLLDNFTKVDWTIAKDASAEIRLSQVAGPGGSALKIAYDLKGGRWVSIGKGFLIDDFRGKALSLQVKGKGANNNLEIKLVDEDDTNYGLKRPIPLKNTDWTPLTISEADFSYWWGGDPVLNRIKDIYIAVSAGDAGAGEVLLADMRLVAASKEGNIGKGGLVFDGQSDEGWMISKGEGASLSLESANGVKGKALAVKYFIPQGQWVSIRRAINADLSTGNPSVVLRLKGEGDANNLELKLVDRDDSVFGKVFTGMAGSNQWQEVKIPLSDFTYLWGGDNRLDTSLIRYLDVAVSGPGGKGRVLINDIKIVQ